MRCALASVAVAAVLAAGCPGFFVGPDADLDRTAVFEHVWRDFDRHYALFIVKGVDWDSLHDVYAPQAAQAATDGDLADVVGAMLRELQDIHVSLLVGQRRYIYRGYDSRPVFFDSAVVSTNYVTDRRPAPNGQLHFGHAGPDVGYIWIPTFRGPGFAADMDAALGQLGNVQALIVDVRDNPGGNLGNSSEIAGRFADRERIYAFVQLRDGPRHQNLTPRTPRTISPAGARRFARPVVVLTNRRTTSAAESFVLAMRVLRVAVVVGDSTAGASGGALARELPNGWTYQFSWALVSTLDSAIYEEVGLAPDVWVRGSAEELAAGRDAALDTALAVVRRALP